MFERFNLSEETLKALRKKGYRKPTPVQEKAVPLLLEGRDLVGQAQTGTGKTAAFGLPAVELVDPSRGEVQVLVLVPTRELAIQVAKEVGELGRERGVKVLALYGGKPVAGQVELLRRLRPQVVVGTPGRIRDLLERGVLDLSKVRFFVLDEADRMLDMGFIDDIEFIHSKTPPRKQTALFSATLPEEIRPVIKRFLRPDHGEVRIEPEKPTAEKVSQTVYRVREEELFDTFLRKLEETPFRKAIVFTQTKVEADELARRLRRAGFRAEAIHGDHSQTRRERVLRDFRRGRIDLLVATDVAARGLDISGVDAVFNYKLPLDAESYVHRIGRTGRAGREGVALSFSSDREDDRLQRVRKVAGDAFRFVNLSDRPVESGGRRPSSGGRFKKTFGGRKGKGTFGRRRSFGNPSGGG
ncbi:MAG: DEAD/DEAH box helicase [Aquificae bacterium]|nr:DEAD/DEAH box helicase [Aquificota bacterium]